jgi:hypothetical protein
MVPNIQTRTVHTYRHTYRHVQYTLTDTYSTHIACTDTYRHTYIHIRTCQNTHVKINDTRTHRSSQTHANTNPNTHKRIQVQVNWGILGKKQQPEVLHPNRYSITP